MSVQNMVKAGLLSIAVTAIIAASSGFAADPPAKSGSSMELKHKVAIQEKVDVKDLDEQVAHMEVVDSNGNVYLLIPLKTAQQKGTVAAQGGKIIVEYVHPYTGRLGN